MRLSYRHALMNIIHLDGIFYNGRISEAERRFDTYFWPRIWSGNIVLNLSPNLDLQFLCAQVSMIVRV